jgi:hypothetical protein
MFSNFAVISQVFEFCSDMSEAFLLPGLFFPMTKPADNNKKKVPA